MVVFGAPAANGLQTYEHGFSETKYHEAHGA